MGKQYDKWLAGEEVKAYPLVSIRSLCLILRGIIINNFKKWCKNFTFLGLYNVKQYFFIYLTGCGGKSKGQMGRCVFYKAEVKGIEEKGNFSIPEYHFV